MKKNTIASGGGKGKETKRTVEELAVMTATFNWQQAGWPKATCNRTALRDALGGPETRYRLNTPLCEPIEPLNEPLNDWLAKLIGTHPGARLPYLKSVVGASTATVERAVAALIAAGRVEHRGSKKTGGYYIRRD